MGPLAEVPIEDRLKWKQRQEAARGRVVDVPPPDQSRKYPQETLAEATGQVFGAPQTVVLSNGERVLFKAPKMGELKKLLAYAATIKDEFKDLAGIAKFTEHMMLYHCMEWTVPHTESPEEWFNNLDGNDGILLVECMAQLVDLQALMQKATNISGKVRGLRPSPASQ